MRNDVSVFHLKSTVIYVLYPYVCFDFTYLISYEMKDTANKEINLTRDKSTCIWGYFVPITLFCQLLEESSGKQKSIHSFIRSSIFNKELTWPMPPSLSTTFRIIQMQPDEMTRRPSINFSPHHYATPNDNKKTRKVNSTRLALLLDCTWITETTPNFKTTRKKRMKSKTTHKIVCNHKLSVTTLHTKIQADI